MYDNDTGTSVSWDQEIDNGYYSDSNDDRLPELLVSWFIDDSNSIDEDTDDESSEKDRLPFLVQQFTDDDESSDEDDRPSLIPNHAYDLSDDEFNDEEETDESNSDDNNDHDFEVQEYFAQPKIRKKKRRGIIR